MYLQIKHLVLWPRNQTLKPRIINFHLGNVNVISGGSKTGKSAIIPIIDYCMGSDKCSIPVGTIRDYCEWFGVVVQTEAGEKLLARREPGGQKSTGEMFLQEAPLIAIPDRIDAKNTTVDSVKRNLDDLAGLSGLDFTAGDSASGFKGRPSFRDMAAFTFQPQNIVANPDVLFYKADTYEHREKLRMIFPYVLGAVTPRMLAIQHELAELQRQLRSRQSQLTSMRRVSLTWMAELRSRITEAKELGLLEEQVPSDAGRDELIDLLRKAVEAPLPEARITIAAVSEAVGELSQLQREETDASINVSGLRKRFSEMAALKDSVQEYRSALEVRRDRLKVSEWLRKVQPSVHDCPVCGNDLGIANDKVESLYSALQAVEDTAGSFERVPAAFDRELEQVRSELNHAVERLEAIRIRRASLQRFSSEAQQAHYNALRVSRFAGNLEEALENFSRIGAGGELSEEVMGLQEQVRKLEAQVSEAQIKNRLGRALSVVNNNASRLLPDLDTERPDDPVQLIINDLSLKIVGREREDYLWEIGSGANWLSYHVALSLALQQLFLSGPSYPVPSFLVYDQPSQVYFPKRLADRGEAEDSDPKWRDEDREAVKKVFQVLASAVGQADGRLQIIVLDHAAENVWGDISGITLVEEWREGRKLVPVEWL
jgi:hypothetical protein